tara:strand:+ start:3116 stop:3790 length:675 start_codon:yes stop_codon:yes gene_type:complete
MIHQVYWDFTQSGKTWRDIVKYKDNMLETQYFCKVHNYEYKLWDLKDLEKLIEEDYPEYLDLFNGFRYNIQKADFARYCILHKYGGLYIDCDIRPMKNLDGVFDEWLYFVYWANSEKKLPYNAVMGCKKNNPLFLDIMKECQRSYNEKSLIKKYDEWKGRFIFQTTGHFMLNRVMKKNNINKDKYFHDDLYIRNPDKKDMEDIGDPHTALFYDGNASVWYDNLI